MGSLNGSTTLPLNYNDLGFTLAVSGLAVVVLQLLFFSVSIICKFDKVKDIAGGICFVTVACVSLLLDKYQITWDTHKRQILMTLFVCSWAIRLAGFLFARHIRMGQDYQPTNTNTWCKHVAYWVFQMLWVFIVSLPVMCMNSSELYEHGDLWTDYDVAGTTLFTIGAVGEFIADQQKFNWKYNHINKGMWVTFGFWGWSRHPNYFFEMVTWLGIFLLSCNVLEGMEWLSVCSPLFVIFILLFVSGLPVVEASADAKYGKYEEYCKYKRGTSILLPIHPWLYSRVPRLIRCTLLLDFPMYNHLQKEMEAENLSSPPTQV